MSSADEGPSNLNSHHPFFDLLGHRTHLWLQWFQNRLDAMEGGRLLLLHLARTRAHIRTLRPTGTRPSQVGP